MQFQLFNTKYKTSRLGGLSGGKADVDPSLSENNGSENENLM